MMKQRPPRLKKYDTEARTICFVQMFCRLVGRNMRVGQLRESKAETDSAISAARWLFEGTLGKLYPPEAVVV